MIQNIDKSINIARNRMFRLEKTSFENGHSVFIMLIHMFIRIQLLSNIMSLMAFHSQFEGKIIILYTQGVAYVAGISKTEILYT